MSSVFRLKNKQDNMYFVALVSFCFIKLIYTTSFETDLTVRCVFMSSSLIEQLGMNQANPKAANVTFLGRWQKKKKKINAAVVGFARARDVTWPIFQKPVAQAVPQANAMLST